VGQVSEVKVFRFITATRVEEGILQKATYKKGLDDKIIQAGMFNDNASDLDRQKKLQELIRGADEDDKEMIDKPVAKNDGITSYQQINEWMARSEE
jgi:SNF2 family DNA or RNA helicase